MFGAGTGLRTPGGTGACGEPAKRKVVPLADELAVERYRVTRHFPPQERYGLRAQIRRAAVSVPTNTVEGCARRSAKDDLYFVRAGLGSAPEARCLLGRHVASGSWPHPITTRWKAGTVRGSAGSSARSTSSGGPKPEALRCGAPRTSTPNPRRGLPEWSPTVVESIVPACSWPPPVRWRGS
ncbi:MAG: four helix bundle protein [Myxococcales bacterium]|nr:four helix bundle protein [Myxococcales bacterium]